VVSGSDVAESPATRHLSRLGVRIAVGHDAVHVQGADVVVVSSAVRPDNPEVLAARAYRVPVVAARGDAGRADAAQAGIAIAGTHGKTTTTSLVASVLAAGDSIRPS